MASRISISISVPVLFGSFLIALLGVSSPAAAASPSTGGGSGPEQEACEGRSIGDPCTLPNNRMATCAQATCNRLDYSGGSPPKAIEESCVVCKVGDGAQGEAEAHDGPPMLGGDAGQGGETTDPPANEPANEPEAKQPPSSSSRCSVDAQGGSGFAGLALLAGLALAVRRRRRL